MKSKSIKDFLAAERAAICVVALSEEALNVANCLASRVIDFSRRFNAFPCQISNTKKRLRILIVASIHSTLFPNLFAAASNGTVHALNLIYGYRAWKIFVQRSVKMC